MLYSNSNKAQRNRGRMLQRLEPASLNRHQLVMTGRIEVGLAERRSAQKGNYSQPEPVSRFTVKAIQKLSFQCVVTDIISYKLLTLLWKKHRNNCVIAKLYMLSPWDLLLFFPSCLEQKMNTNKILNLEHFLRKKKSQI